MLLLTLPVTAYALHAMRASTRPPRLPCYKMTLSSEPALPAEPPPPAVSQHRRIDYVGMLQPAVASNDVLNPAVESSGTANEALEAIFLLHADGTTLKPGTPMYKASQDLANNFPALMGLVDDALVGRLFQFLDEDGDGVLEVHEWVNGICMVKKWPSGLVARYLGPCASSGHAPACYKSPCYSVHAPRHEGVHPASALAVLQDDAIKRASAASGATHQMRPWLALQC